MALLTRLTNSGTTMVAPGSPKGLQRFQNYLSSFLWSRASQRQQCKSSTQLNAIECFTNQLVSRKTHEWKELRDNLQHPAAEEANCGSSFGQNVGLMSKGMMSDLKALRSPQLGLDIRSLSQPQLDNLLLATLETKNKVDFLYLIRQCIRWQQLPCSEVFISCLKYLSSLGRMQQLESLSEICRRLNHPFAIVYSDLTPFKAIALWHNGNADDALMTLYRGYGASLNTEKGRRMTRNAFRTIVEETLAQKSEAVLVRLLKVSHSIYHDNNDIFVVACVWKQCFASNWFCDQKSAIGLFEHYSELRQLVDRRAIPLCSSFLSRHNVDAAHRLIELFLQHNRRTACSNCLRLLFNYQYIRKDLRACAEIVKSCNELNMTLDDFQNEQFLSLFLDQSDFFKTAAENCNRATNYKTKSFQFKF